MHHSKRFRVEICEGTDRWGTGWGETARAEDVLGLGGSSEYVVRRDGGALAELGEEITAQQRLGRFFEQHSGFPAVWHVWRVDVTHAMPAQFELDGRTREVAGPIITADDGAGFWVFGRTTTGTWDFVPDSDARLACSLAMEAARLEFEATVGSEPVCVTLRPLAD